MGIGDWGLGIGDWGLGIGDWAQSPIPNPQFSIKEKIFFSIIYNIIFINKNITKCINLNKDEKESNEK